MKITPLEIKRQQFKKVMRGYDPVEVDTFLDVLSHELEDVLSSNKDLSDKIIELHTQLKANQIVDKARMDFSRMKEEIANLKARKESILSRLKVLLTSEIDLIKALEIDEDDMTGRDTSKGTGKEHIAIDEILK